MAQPSGSPDPESKASLGPAAQSLRGTPQLRRSRVDTGSLGRYRGSVTAGLPLRECPSQGSLMLSGTGSARRRGALRELLGLQGTAPAGWLTEERTEDPAAGGPGSSSGPGGSGLCLEPREHAWILAAAEGRFEVLQELLEAEPGLLLRCDPISGYTVLHWLAKHGRHEEIILVHDFAQRRGLRLDVSAAGSGGLTPLHLAALQGHDMVIKVLVGALGADPTRRDHSGHRACYYLRPDAPQNLRELSGAEDWEMTSVRERGNANNNSSSTATAWTLKRTLSSAGATAVGTSRKAGSTRAREKNTAGSRVAHIHGLLRQLFPFFQDR